ncbi:hypothetical protein RJ639_003000 [Escallonia herrerae]|uniref:Uncharacterized protein n=1 Tax=Escallonia herrerae TaxID=1293975 RepID=A0AA88W5B0_9ASTE|nr:hypothetical protein RJ639_003000 [Escallonia herrerae]
MLWSEPYARSITQLTLRTRTSGLLIRATANYVEALSNGKLLFNKDLVYVPRTRHHEHPDFLCSIDLYYVESEQVIAKICTEISTLCYKEKVRKHISSKIEGEMH